MNKLIEVKLQKLKEKNKIPHVILFTGIDKLKTKETLINAAQKLSGELRLSEAQGNLVFLETEDESIKIEQVRDLIKKTQLKNWTEGQYRFIIIYQAEKLTVQSSNALLKSLEEPQGDLCYLLAAPNSKSILQTLVSRSLILRYPIEKLESINDGNLFKKAFFEGDSEGMMAAPKAEVLKDWYSFTENLKEEFISRVYEDDFVKEEWFRLFDFLEDLEVKIEAHMDIKWIGNAIERFNYDRG